jgi:molybdenum cofactor cytidylyltransferase
VRDGNRTRRALEVKTQNGPMDEPMRIAGVVLAAGASTRFGSPKQLAVIGDRTMLESVIEVARAASLAPIIAVVPPGIAVPPDVVPVVNTEPAAGLSRSLRMGIAALPPDVDAAVILLGDQPTLSVETVRAVVGAARSDRPLVAAQADGRLGPPVLVMRDTFGLAHEASGDEGLRSILTEHPQLVTSVDVDAHPPDVDTPADLGALA